MEVKIIRWIILIIAGLLSIVFASYLLYTKLTIPFNFIVWMTIVTGFMVGSVIIYFAARLLVKAKTEVKPMKEYDAIKMIIRQMKETGMPIATELDDNDRINNMPIYDIACPIGKFFYWRYEDEDPRLGPIKRNIFLDMKNKVLWGEIRADELNTRPSIAIKVAEEILSKEQIKEEIKT